ncbi:MAG: ATP-binding cassette domain-containing protein [Antricoccus sp.]
MSPGEATRQTGTVVAVRDVVKTFRRGPDTVEALNHVNLQLSEGEVVALVGPSGSGKSTLLNVLCGWESPDFSDMTWAADLQSSAPADLGWEQIAIVPQTLGLLAELQARENILLPARARHQIADWVDRADALMDDFDIDQLALRLPDEMSLGEQQRCAVARALLLRPRLLLADEPTAHQDPGYVSILFEELRNHAREHGACLVATHNPATWDYADRIVSMQDGVLHDGPPAEHL